MFLQDLISEALEISPTAIAYHVSRRLASMFADRVLVEGCDYCFTLLEYAKAGHCRLQHEENVHGQVATDWDEDKGLRDEPRNVWYEVNWQGHLLDVLLMSWDECYTTNYWILAETEEIARAFLREVCAWDPEIQGEILVFDGGRWDGHTGMYRAIQQSTLDDLVLPGTLKADIVADLQRFFQSRETYHALGAPWRRGILLAGPPGNGKTHLIKGLAHSLGYPCLYVKSFKSERRTEQSNIRFIFERARRAAPCLLVLEDLDSLVTDDNRSFLLNELDGFAANEGLVTLATTNHPEKLDPALVNRPSRFDRKYHFDLPGPTERSTYVDHWADRLPSALVLAVEARRELVERTEGFSFAYLKELFLSSILLRAGSPVEESFDRLVLGQAIALRAQMKNRSESTKDKADEATDA